MRQHVRGDARDGRSHRRGAALPDAMWFCFFSSSVRRGFSSAPPGPPSPGDVDVLFGDDIVCAALLPVEIALLVSVVWMAGDGGGVRWERMR